VLTFVVRRVLLAIPLIWAVLTLTFLGYHLLVPGDPASIMLFGRGSAADVVRLRHQLGLDQPLAVQYWSFIKGAAHFDFGTSIVSHLPVAQDIGTRIPTTLELALGALFLATLFGLAGGILSALFNRNPAGVSITSAAVLGFSIPEFVLGVLLGLVFGVYLGWLPVSGTGSSNTVFPPIDLKHLVLPASCLALGLASALTRLVRATMLDVLGQDFVRTARAKGVRRRIIILKHVLRNAFLPVVTVYGLSVASLLSGAVIIENIFALQGLGTLALSAVNVHDYPVVEGTTFFFAILLIGANLIVDVTYAFIDPRISVS
jgi:peptide/nickel transport system permease protein